MAGAVASAQAAANLETYLLRLADRSLITAILAGGQPARYRLLGTIRAYAAGRAPEVAAQVRQGACPVLLRARRGGGPGLPPPGRPAAWSAARPRTPSATGSRRPSGSRRPGTSCTPATCGT